MLLILGVLLSQDLPKMDKVELNSDGLKVDGVAHTKEQAKSEGSPVVFM
jgi:hypothetical protein